MKLFWGRIPPDPSTRLVSSALAIMPPPPPVTKSYLRSCLRERERLSWACHKSDSQVKTFGSGALSLLHRTIVYLQMRRKCCHCLHMVESFSSWIRMKVRHKVRHKVLKMSHDELSEESEKCKRRTRYEVHNAT